jgi:cell wall-associated NlpC family hydrolase
VANTDGAALRLRAAPGLSAPILQRLPEGTIVMLVGGSAKQADKERWLPVQVDKQKGWVAARYLVRVVALAPNVRQLPPSSALGERVAAAAEALVGQPYVWAGSAPGGFDCSGLVQWVYTQAGVRMPRLIDDQLTTGKRVEPAALQAGDIVSFNDTYQAGLSHIGIYIGKDRFVHAADEAQGVTISNLLDEYWKPRLHAAVRVGS